MKRSARCWDFCAMVLLAALPVQRRKHIRQPPMLPGCARARGCPARPAACPGNTDESQANQRRQQRITSARPTANKQQRRQRRCLLSQPVQTTKQGDACASLTQVKRIMPEFLSGNGQGGRNWRRRMSPQPTKANAARQEGGVGRAGRTTGAPFTAGQKTIAGAAYGLDRGCRAGTAPARCAGGGCCTSTVRSSTNTWSPHT